MTNWVLTLNAGSSSLKMALFEEECGTLERRATGQVEGLGTAPHLVMLGQDGETIEDRAVKAEEAVDPHDALELLFGVLERRFQTLAIAVVGHRVVHGGITYSAPVVVTDEVMAAVSELNALAPLHQPHNVAGIAAARAHFPEAVQVACFDTAFHRAHPWVNDVFALPLRYYQQGVRRYGFHGLSYEYVTSYLRDTAPHHAAGRLVVAHLGNGASMCAIRNGRSIGSTMGFSALDGLPMGTRCGQIDPGVLLYLIEHEGLDAKGISDLLYKHSGLKGLSGLSQDMRELEKAGTPEAEQAIDYFVFRVRRELGAMTAILNGIDALAFCGGIGENSWRIRERVCAGLDWLGLELDGARNRHGEAVISTDLSRVKVFVVRTNEDLMIARHALERISH